VLLLGSIGLVVWLAARIYRVGILMYGKRPTLPEALRWLRAS
jgi:ABC-2 type transport system permease protein